jgi:hypothetical protein
MGLEYLLPEYVKSKLDLIDISLSSLRDAIRGTGNYTLTDLYNILSTFSGKFAAAVTLADNLANPTTTIVGAANLGWDGTYWRRAAVDTSGRFRVAVDVDNAGLAKDTTLSTFSGKFPAATALSDSLANPTTTIVGCANLGWDGTYWRRVAVDTSSRLKVAVDADNVGLLKDSKIPNPLGVITNLDVAGTTANALAVIPQSLPARQPYTIADIAVSTTEGSTSIAAPGAKILVIKNKGDVDVLIGINGTVPTTNPLIVRARTAKVIQHKGVTQVNYKVASGSTTIDIEYYN